MWVAHRCVPEGRRDNSPPFQRWDRSPRRAASPGGTTEPLDGPLIRPDGTDPTGPTPESLESHISRRFSLHCSCYTDRVTASDWLMILAVLLAPLLAVQVQKWLEHLREQRQQRLGVFHTLMATRAARTSPAHVEALNRIDLEFRGSTFRREGPSADINRAVRDAWKVYRDHLNTPPSDALDPSSWPIWTKQGDELFAELLYQMGHSLGYDFDKVELKKGVYWPQAYGDEEFYQRVAREWTMDVIRGKKAIPIRLATEDPSNPNASPGT